MERTTGGGMKIPTFQEINQLQKPFGTYDIYTSVSGLGFDSFPYHKTATLTVCRWEWKSAYRRETRIHRTHSEAKIRLDKDEWDYCCRILLRAIAQLNEESTAPEAKRVIMDMICKKRWSDLEQQQEG
jgi:hypothetical protein